ncbi:hypothetical protein [Nocardioides speluncae]|uniref:hypothetical protein n=1 Tax=Nocardioides speluncae TaxID=2670337 RepID=UPI000D697E46|nr:hypothetical protein [Nocardioides speluncae]
MSVEEDKPVLTGLLALVGVGLVVGLVAGLVVLAGTQFVGVGGDSSASDDSTGQQSLYLPDPKPTKSGDDPLVTLPAGEEETADEGDDEETPEEETSPTKPAKPEIALSAGATQIGPMERLDLTGIYQKGEGAILQVQRQEGKAWEDFYSVTVNVSGGIFTTVIQTSHPGINVFRVVDTDTGLASNSVRVRVG